MRHIFFLFALVLNGGAFYLAYYVHANWYWGLAATGLLTLIGIRDILFSKYTILRNFPVIGHIRFLFLKIRPEIHQYFVESNNDGTPFAFENRQVIYARSKGTLDTVPFGTQRDTGRIGYEWINHSFSPIKLTEDDVRVAIGIDGCKQPYRASILNISAMSFGALSKNAILALNDGAAQGGFAHNTGEGSISSYHEKMGGDLIWQIGTGYFGCRESDGSFSETAFADKANAPQVKMIEIKLSQGAKPGKGGILPGPKVTPEIAVIRGVPVGEDVISPASHSEFSNPLEMMEFVAKLRDLSGGKPVGIKMCLGKRREFYSICKGMLATGIHPDYIAIDGGEGGTGAAPIEFSNSVGTPLTEALIEIDNALTGFGLRPKMKLIASGKMTTGFHMVRNLAIGADLIYSARGMMMALGCIQALKCHNGHCPTGITTQNPRLYKGLSVPDKGERVYRFHKELVHSILELMQASGIKSADDFRRWHILKKTGVNEVLNYNELYPYVEPGSFLGSDIPQGFERVVNLSYADRF